MPDEPVVTADIEALVRRPFIKSLMERVTKYQEKEYNGNVKIDWQAGTYYTGVLAAHLATGEPAFREAAIAWGEAAKWKIGPRPFYADDICMGQTMLDLYLLDRDPAYIKDITRVLKQYGGKKMLTADEVHTHQPADGPVEMRGRHLWWWSDALYMAPPVLVRMHAATGEQHYLDLLHELYWDTCDFLFDAESSLFYRDSDFFPGHPGNARDCDKNFWSRGNGWVYAGLVRLLDYLPVNDPFYPRYLELFHTLTRRIVTLQKPDGLWSSWLNRSDLEQGPEVSGSGFFTFGLLAGVNRGWLDEKCYLPLALCAWRGLTRKLSLDGRLGFAQLVDSAPGPVRPESSIDYTHGAFLLAASELYSLNLDLAALRKLEPACQPRLMMSDASWSCFNDERAVIADEHVYLGAVDGAGRTRFYAYRLDPNNAPSIHREPVDLSTWIDGNDHHNPSLLRFNDKLLAVYSKHDTADFWNWRVAAIPAEQPTWGAMQIEWSDEHTFSTGPAKTNCANLVRLSAENGRIFNFYHATDSDPHLSWSDDDAVTWQQGLRFLDSGDSSVRAHVKCTDNGHDRIDLVFTDGLANGSLGHVFYQNGAFHATDGKVIRSLEEIASNPFSPAEATPVPDGGSCSGRCWIQDLKYDHDGQPVVVYVSPTVDGGETILCYWIARWDGKSGRWTSSRIARAGCDFFQDERHVAGFALDPDNDRVAYLSANVDPATGLPNSTGRCQLYRGTACGTGESYAWVQLTFDATRDNIRPFVPRGHGVRACVLWLRGTYRSHSDYQMDIYGLLDAEATSKSSEIASGFQPMKAGDQPSAAKAQVPSKLREAV